MKHRLLSFICIVLTCAVTGCISSSSTSYTDVERTKVSFGSERAGRLFYETLSKLPHERREESKNQVSLVLINFERKTITGPNRFFNQAVERCDTDRDGTITEEEAAIFSSSVKHPTARIRNDSRASYATSLSRCCSTPPPASELIPRAPGHRTLHQGRQAHEDGFISRCPPSRSWRPWCKKDRALGIRLEGGARPCSERAVRWRKA